MAVLSRAVVAMLVSVGVRLGTRGQVASPAGSTSPRATASSTPVPTPTSPPAAQRLNGGSYTWASGVTLKLSFALVELWGNPLPLLRERLVWVSQAG